MYVQMLRHVIRTIFDDMVSSNNCISHFQYNFSSIVLISLSILFNLDSLYSKLNE